MEKNGQNIKIKDLKSPEELVIKMNNIRLNANVNALINTGSAGNALAEENKYEYDMNEIKIKLNKHIAIKLRNINQIQIANEKYRKFIKKIQEEINYPMNRYYDLISNKVCHEWINQWDLYIPKELIGMDCYEHHLQVNDNTLNLQKGGTTPSKYQKAGQAAIRRMLENGIIKSAQSPYIQPLVTAIKGDGSMRLCLDARKENRFQYQTIKSLSFRPLSR